MGEEEQCSAKMADLDKEREFQVSRLRAALPKGWRVLRATNKQTVKIHYILSPQGQRFSSVKEALGSGQWPNVKKKFKKGKVIPEKGKVIPDQGKVKPEKGEKLASSKFAPKTKFMRAQDLLRGLLRKNHAAKKDSTNMDKGGLCKEDPQSGSEVVSWTVKCDDCGFQAENITSLATHKKTNHARLGEE